MIFRKYFLLFIVQFLVFAAILCIFDYQSLNLHKFYSNVLQGVLFGLFMTFYSYWDDKRKKKKENNQETDEVE